VTPPPRRLQSPTERELTSDAARRQRDTARDGVVESFTEESFADLTDRYEGEELDRMRALRAEQAPTVSLVKLEQKHEELKTSVSGLSDSVTKFKIETVREMGDVKAGMGKIAGAVDGLAGKVDILAGVVTQKRAEEHVKVTTTMEVDAAKRISDVNVEQAEKLDKVAARKAQRDFWFKMAGSGAVGAVVLKILQHFGVL
jgi:hypothetical protein